jgi:catechol 2,3-dioxygenase-like lactoylglutathione lyase family enzyme
MEATHHFYTEVMGFELAKVVAAPTPVGGWAKHVFYETGSPDGGMIAFWDLHVDSLGDFPTDLNASIGLPTWVNHLAFDAASLDELAAHTRRWQEHGITVLELDHGFCRSIYATDPNGITVEFCCTTRPFSAAERQWARDNVLRPEVELDTEQPPLTVHEPLAPASI